MPENKLLVPSVVANSEFPNYGRPLHLLPDRRVPFLGQPAALPLLPGVVPDSPVRGSAGVPVPRGEASEPRRARGLGPARAAAAAEVVRPERSVM